MLSTRQCVASTSSAFQTIVSFFFPASLYDVVVIIRGTQQKLIGCHKFIVARRKINTLPCLFSLFLFFLRFFLYTLAIVSLSPAHVLVTSIFRASDVEIRIETCFLHSMSSSANSVSKTTDSVSPGKNGSTERRKKACWLWSPQRWTMICALCLPVNTCCLVPSFSDCLSAMAHNSRNSTYQPTYYNDPRDSVRQQPDEHIYEEQPYYANDRPISRQSMSRANGRHDEVSLIFCARLTLCARGRWGKRMTASNVARFQIRVSTFNCRTIVCW